MTELEEIAEGMLPRYRAENQKKPISPRSFVNIAMWGESPSIIDGVTHALTNALKPPVAKQSNEMWGTW